MLSLGGALFYYMTYIQCALSHKNKWGCKTAVNRVSVKVIDRHPELTGETRMYRHYANEIENNCEAGGKRCSCITFASDDWMVDNKL